MAGSVEARGEVLRRIRTATLATADPAAIDAEWKGIRRAYKDAASVDREGLLHQLEDRLRDYDAGVYRVGPDGVRELIAQILAERGNAGWPFRKESLRIGFRMAFPSLKIAAPT